MVDYRASHATCSIAILSFGTRCRDITFHNVRFKISGSQYNYFTLVLFDLIIPEPSPGLSPSWRRSRPVQERSNPLVPELRLVQPAVDTAAADQLLMGALLADAALGHHHDPVGVLDRRQAVGDDQCGAACGQLGQ
jgi:hypothetical protein